MTTSDASRLAWAHVLARLASLTGGEPREASRVEPVAARIGRIAPYTGPRKTIDRRPAESGQSSSTITVLERVSEEVATISWHDPTRCRYGEQRWQRGVAARRGYCAVSGLSIKRGDVIFRPARARPAPCNGDEMILESALEQFEVQT